MAMISHSRSPPRFASHLSGDLRRLWLGLDPVHTSAAHVWPPVQDQPVVRDDARPELDLRGGEIAAELPHDLLAHDGCGFALVLTQRSEPRAARACEVARIRAEHLDLEEGLEAEHDLAQMRAQRLRIEAQHEIAQRPAPEGRIGVWRAVVSDRLQGEPAAGGQPLDARAEEP